VAEENSGRMRWCLNRDPFVFILCRVRRSQSCIHQSDNQEGKRECEDGKSGFISTKQRERNREYQRTDDRPHLVEGFMDPKSPAPSDLVCSMGEDGVLGW